MFDDHDVFDITQMLFFNRYREKRNIVIPPEQFSGLVDKNILLNVGEIKDDGYSLGLFLGYKIVPVHSGVMFWMRCNACGTELYPEKRDVFVCCRKCGKDILL